MLLHTDFPRIWTGTQTVIGRLAVDLYSALENITEWIFISWVRGSLKKGSGGVEFGCGKGSSLVAGCGRREWEGRNPLKFSQIHLLRFDQDSSVSVEEWQSVTVKGMGFRTT